MENRLKGLMDEMFYDDEEQGMSQISMNVEDEPIVVSIYMESEGQSAQLNVAVKKKDRKAFLEVLTYNGLTYSVQPIILG